MDEYTPPHSDAPVAPGAVLVVDDEAVNRLLLAQQVTRLGRLAVHADNGRAALDIVRQRKCDLLLLDMQMPEMDGMQLLQILRQDEETRSIPVIVISSSDNESTAVKCIEAGAEDFLSKPFDPVLLRARISACLEKKRLRDQEAAMLKSMRSLQQRLEERNKLLEDANRRLAQMALTDMLTGLPNRRHAMETLHRLWHSSTRHQRHLACLMIDVDFFKRVNDQLGHDAGDLVLQAVAQRLRSAARSDEVVCRMGGEEFLVLCEDTDPEGATRCADRLLKAISDQPMQYDDHELPVTISIGVSNRNDSVTSAEHLLKKADQALYQAKQNGRNRLCLAI